jgi:hypothetical protein
MKDTDDPVNGAAFEKQVSASFEDFAEFLILQYGGASIFHAGIDKGFIFTFWKDHEHIASYVRKDAVGYFGGIRIGSQNPFVTDHGVELGTSFVKNPFKVKE